MFDLELGDDLELLIETARSFAAEELAPRLREAEAARRVEEAAQRSFAQIGLAGLELPEELGGAGLGSLARALVNEELAAADPGAALALDPLGPALYPLARLGGEPALREFATPLLQNQGSRALLVTENDASLRRDGERLSGRIAWVPSERIDLLVYLDSDGATAIRDGFHCEPLRGSGLRAAGACEVTLDKAPIAGHWRDAQAATLALAQARLYAAGLLLGVLRRAAEFSRAYALERVAFGRPIAHHQALAFLITDMQMAIDGARLLLHEAAWRADQGQPCAAAAASAFVEAVEASRFVGPNGVQILGGHGFMQDYPAEKYMRESRALSLWIGGVDAAREEAGQALRTGGAPVPLSCGEAV